MNQPTPTKQPRDQTQNTIDEIVECAVKWVSADADNPDTPSPEWQEVMGLIKAAPEMRGALTEGVEAAQKVMDSWESGDLAGAVRTLQKWLETARNAVTASA